MPFLLAEILNFQGSTHLIGVGSLSYHYYTRRIWGHSKNYDLTIDTSIGAEAVEEIIRSALELRQKQKISS